MIDSTMTDLQRLRALLQRYNIRLLARETGINRITLRRIRDGETSPTLDMVGKIWDVVAADAIAANEARILDGRRTARVNARAMA
jgi:hypothetical protein